jgi:hypothetical protein
MLVPETILPLNCTDASTGVKSRQIYPTILVGYRFSRKFYLVSDNNHALAVRLIIGC